MVSLLQRNHISLLLIVLLFSGAGTLSAQNDTLRFSFPSDIGKRDSSYLYPLFLDDSLLTSDSLLAGEFTFGSGGTVFDVTGIDTGGTVLGAAASLLFNSSTGKVSFANSQPITGKGIFIKFIIKIRTNASGSSITTLSNILLNEGNITAVMTSGFLRPMDIFISPKNPPQDRIVGDTIQFSVSGDVNLPVTWTVSDTHIVSINSSGRVIGKNVGQTTVTVRDNLGLSDQSLLFPILPATLRSLTVTIRDTAVMQNLTFLMPIKISTVTGLGITSAQFRLSYHPSLLTADSVITANSMTSGWFAPSIVFGNGTIDVAMAGAQALQDSGTMVFIRFKVKRFANFSSGVSLSNVLFNENLNAIIQNGIFTPINGPVITITGKPQSMIRGETAQLSASGGTIPYRWRLYSDSSIASIDSVSGILTAKTSGFATYAAIDANGFDAKDSIFVNDVRFIFSDTTLAYNDSISYPIRSSSLSSLSITASQFILPYDTAKIQFTGVVTAGTLTNGMLMEVKDSAGIRIAVSGALPLNGSGTFIVLKFKIRGLLSLGHVQPMAFSQMELNESGSLQRTFTQKPGMITVTNVPNVPPVFLQKLRDTTIAENQLLQVQMSAFDANGDSLLFGLFSGPTGAVMTPKGLFTWQPNYSQSGNHKVVYDVGDYHPNGVTKDSAIITVTNVNRPPVFTRPMNDTTINEGTLLSFDVDAVDPDGNAVIFSLLGASAGMKIDSMTGLFTWTPSSAQSGLHRFVIRASDGLGAFAHDSVSISVLDINLPPFFTKMMRDTAVNENQLLQYSVIASDPDGDIVRYTIQNIVSGMMMDSVTGTLSWTPSYAQAGVYNIVLRASDGKGGIASNPVIITVNNVNRPPFFTHQIPETLSVSAGSLVNVQFTASDPDGDSLTFAIVEAPSGASISSQGVFSWTSPASVAGVHRIIISASDGGIAIRDTVHLNVVVNNTPPRIVTSLQDTVISEGQLFSFQYQASDSDGDSLHWSLLLSGPQGLTITSAGLLIWTPNYSQAGNYFIVAGVSDGKTTVPDTAAITVVNTNRSPLFTSVLNDTTLYVDSLFMFSYSGEDPDSDSITFSFAKHPASASISADGKITWTPARVAAETLIVVLSDGAAFDADTAFITVTGFPSANISATILDFGTTIYGALPVKSSLIKNTGRIPLRIKTIPGLTSNEHFTSDLTLTDSIAPGSERIISVTFTPKQIGSHSGTMILETNDPLKPLIAISMKGTAISVAPVKRKLLVDLTHNSTVPLKDSLDGMTQLFGALKNSGVEVAFAESLFTPAGYDAVLIVTPRKPFTAQEKKLLREFIVAGGLAVMMGEEPLQYNNTVLNELLADTLRASGLQLGNSSVADSAHAYRGNAAYPLLTIFADSVHPYLKGVDTLVMFGSTFVTTDSGSIPFAQFTSPTYADQSASTSRAAVGMSKLGKGTVLLFGDAAIWRNSDGSSQNRPDAIAAKDNFNFALNIFSVTENYEIKMPQKTPSEIYQLVSIPFELENLDILSVLKKNLGEINPLRWRLFGKYDPVRQKYREFPSAGFTTFKRGEAYWLITRGEFALTFGTATIVPAQDYFPIRIGPGYSLIGNPFPYQVSWKDSRKGDSVQSVLWRFNPSTNGFVPESLSLAPFTGYFVKNLSADSVTIYINPRSGSLPKQGVVQTFAEAEWRIKIGGVSGKARDEENVAGVSLNALQEFDKHDIAEPPPTPSDYLMVRFTNPGWSKQAGSYAADIRPVSADGQYWEFDVTADKAFSKVRLTFDQTGNMPPDFSIYLVDHVTEQVTRFTKSFTYDFTMTKSETRRSFRLLAGKESFVENNTNGIPLVPIAYEMKQNYPNPFNPHTAIHYSLGHSGAVTLDVFNLLGQKVRSLGGEHQSIGSYTVEWDGKDDDGISVASGVYFYKITVISNGEKLFTNTKKMVLLR